jgi:hypothetical protein
MRHIQRFIIRGSHEHRIAGFSIRTTGISELAVWPLTMMASPCMEE